MSSLFARLSAWSQRHLPRREHLEGHRLAGPLARRAELWRFTRRSVPRGVAVGLFVGIFAMIPGVQIVGAALLCVPAKGNIPVAVGMTLLSNPATTPLILAASLWIGGALGFQVDIATFQALYKSGAGLQRWGDWLLSDAGPALLVGLFAISTVAAAIGYLVSSLLWTRWIMHKRRAGGHSGTLRP